MTTCNSAYSNSEVNSSAGLKAKAATRLALLTALLLPLVGCAVVTGSPTVSQVRIIDASPDAGGLDIYQGGTVLAYNLGLGTITSYVQLAPGNYGMSVDAAGTRTQLVTATGTFGAGSQYTVLIGNYLNSIQELILKDQTQAAPSGQISVRFIDQSVRAGAVDLYLVPSGSTIVQVKPILTNITFNTNTGYFQIPDGTYTLIAVPTGTTPTTSSTTLYTGSAVGYSSGAARTYVLLDQQLITTPGLQVIIADDYDSPSS